MSAQTLGFAVQPEDRPVLDELVAYFGDGNRSAYLRATLKVMKSIMIADQLREAQAYGQQRTAELGIDASDVPARIQEFLKATPKSRLSTGFWVCGRRTFGWIMLVSAHRPA